MLTTLDFPGASDTVAYGINEFGTVVGAWDLYDSDGNFIAEHGFTWKKGSFSQVDYPGSADTFVGGINDFGALVGEWDAPPDYTAHGFVRSITGKFTTYDVPVAGEIYTQPNDINDLGLIIGVYFDASDMEHGFLQVGPWFTSLDYPAAYLTDLGHQHLWPDCRQPL